MSAAPRDTWSKPPFIANTALRWAVYLGVIAYFGWVGLTMPIDWNRVAEGIGRAGKIFGGAFPPSFDRSGLLIDGFLESLKIAVLATAGGVLLSIPIAFMSASNVAPKPVYYLGRAIIIIARSFHPVIVAILFVKAVGFGALAGVMALVVATLGFIAKLIAEAIEEMSMKPIEALRAAGAPFLSVVTMGVVPQVLPRFIGFATYQLDSNLRNSTMVGIVGGGGIGATLFTAYQRFDFDVVLAILIVIVALIMVAEIVSGWARKVFQ